MNHVQLARWSGVREVQAFLVAGETTGGDGLLNTTLIAMVRRRGYEYYISPYWSVGLSD